MQLYDQFGREFETGTKPPKEERTLSVAPLTESYRDYVADGLTPEKLAAIFKEADAGDMRRQAELFELIEERDGHLLGERSKRVNAIEDVPMLWAPASDDARDLAVMEFCQEWQENQADWSDTLISLQEAVAKGYSALELNWDTSEGQALPSDLEFVEQKRFIFYGPDGLLTKTPRLITDEEMMGMEIPAWKMIFHRYGGKCGNATRSAVYRVCAWMYIIKHYAIKDWLTFAELYGIPMRVGKYASGAAKEEKAALKRAVASLGTAAAGIISESTKIEFIENTGTGVRADMYSALAKMGDKEMSKALLGQTLTADAGDKGSHALGKIHNEVRLDLLRADARALAATLRYQLIRPIVGFNFGWDTPLPKFYAELKEPEDYKAKAEVLDKVMNRTKVPKVWYHEQMGVPLPKDGEETIGGAPVPGGDKPALTPAKNDLKTIVAKSGAKSDDPTPRDTLAALSGDRFNFADSGPLVDQIASMLDRAGSLEEFMALLEEAGGDLDKEELATRMARGLALADLAGRYDER